MDKKAQGLSLTVVIVAIVALVVLVVLVMLFTGAFSRITPQLASCPNQGGSCVATANDCVTAFGQSGRTVQTQDCSDSLYNEQGIRIGPAGPDDDAQNGVCCIQGQ